MPRPLVNHPALKGSADPLRIPGDTVQLPPIQISADSLALRSSGLDVLIDTGTIPYVSRTEITMNHIVRVPYMEF